MLRLTDASIAPFLAVFLPACSLTIDTKPDGLITAGAPGIAGGAVSNSRVLGGGGGANSAAGASPVGASTAVAGATSTVPYGGGGLGGGDTGGVGATAPITVAGGTGATGGMTATGGRTATGPCTDEGCACTGTATTACNDCGTRACNAATQRWGACSAPQDPAATQCAGAATLQTCGSDGRWVNTACVNPDATNCSVSCVKEATSSICKVSANDADTDGHLAKACTSAPGDDCDDANNAVYPGAIEACDGVDNDCNGKADLNDGFSLSGAAYEEPQVVGDLEWGPSINKFAVITAGGAAFFGTLARTTGMAHFTEWNSAASVDVSGSGIYGRIAWVPARQTFVFSYSAVAMGSNHYVSDMNAQGAVSERYPGASGSVAARTAGDVLIVDTASVYSFDGSTPTTPITFNAPVYSPRIAAAGDKAAVIGTDTGTTVKWLRITESLSAGAWSQLTDAGRFPDIASVSNGYAVAWGTTTGFDYQVMNSADGAVVCGPTHVPTTAVERLAIAGTQHGTLVITVAENSGPVRLFRFNASCSLVDEVLLDETSTSNDDYGARLPFIAVGGGYVAVAWTYDESGIGQRSKTRVFGERLCN